MAADARGGAGADARGGRAAGARTAGRRRASGARRGGTGARTAGPLRAAAAVLPRPAVTGRATQEFFLLTATITVLAVLGLVMTFSASFVKSAAETGDAFNFFERQLLWCLLGLVPLVVAASSDYRSWRRLAGPLLVVSLVATAAVLVPGVGVANNGARRWLALGPLHFQPTEVLKVAVPLYLAHVLAGRWTRLRRGDLRALLVPAAPLLAFVALLVLLEPDLETAMLLVAIGAVVLYAAGLPLRIIAAGGAVAGVVGAVIVATSEFRRGRLAAWLDPFSDPSGYGYQSVQGYYALASGGWFGAGLGEGRGKWLYVPAAHTDFIFVIIGEELGFVGALFVLLLFFALAVGGIRTARRAPDPFGRLLATGVTGWMLLQATINIGSVVGLLPVTGVTLPLVSFGGSSLVFTMFGLGLLLSVARAARRPQAPENRTRDARARRSDASRAPDATTSARGRTP